MAFLHPFAYDIFISYARSNDLPWPGTAKGWVTHFKECLEVALTDEFGRKDIVTVWHDKDRVGYGEHFNEVIKEGVEKSALFLALFSRGYVAEAGYCPKELEWFHEKAGKESYGLKIGHSDRIMNLRLHNIPFTEWPKALEGREGFKFHDDTKLGKQLPPGPLFDRQFNVFFAELVMTIRAFKTLINQRQAETSAADAHAPGSQTVYMSYVEGSLLGHRRRAIEALRRDGVNVLTDVPPPTDEEGHKAKVAEYIGKSDLSVHMLEEEPGWKITDAPDKFYTREQVEIGQSVAKSQLIWVPKTLEVEAIEDATQRDFLNGLEARADDFKNRGAELACKFVREAPTSIASQVLAQLELLKKEMKPGSAEPQGDGRVALINIHRDDSPLVSDLSPVFIERQVELLITPEGDGPRKNVTRFEESLKQASVLIIIFGRVTADWVCERIVSAQQFFVKQECPLKLCGVYIPPDGGERQFDCASRAGPLQVAHITSPNVLRTLLSAFNI